MARQGWPTSLLLTWYTGSETLAWRYAQAPGCSACAPSGGANAVSMAIKVSFAMSSNNIALRTEFSAVRRPLLQGTKHRPPPPLRVARPDQSAIEFPASLNHSARSSAG